MRRRISIGVGLLVGVAWLIWWWQPVEPIEPIYQGKSLSAWLMERDTTLGGLSNEAEAAVHAIGPAAVPVLMNWMNRPTSPLFEWSLWLGSKLGTNRVVLPNHQAERTRAMLGFRALGPAGRSAFPALADLVLYSGDIYQSNDAINALTSSDAATMRRLAAELSNPDAKIRDRAMFALCCIRIAPDEVCLPALEALSNDANPATREAAIKAVAFFNEQMTLCAPLLTNTDPRTRIAAAEMIGRYRARARTYLPNLEAAQADPDPAVRAAVDAAIRQVRVW